MAANLYSSTTNLIKPLRDYSSSDVLNMFAYDLASVNKGTFVQIQGSGWRNTDDVLNILSATAVGASFNGVTSDRYSTTARVTVSSTGTETSFTGATASAAGGGSTRYNKCIGMLLNDVRETDENGEKLAFNPRKAVELSCVISGQTVPILTRGIIVAYASGAVAGSGAFIGSDGTLKTAFSDHINSTKVGTYLGSADNDGYALLKIDINN